MTQRRSVVLNIYLLRGQHRPPTSTYIIHTYMYMYKLVTPRRARVHGVNPCVGSAYYSVSVRTLGLSYSEPINHSQTC